MATTISVNSVTVGETILATDVNTPFTTIVNFLNSIDGGNIQSNTIPGDRIQSNSITGVKLVDGSISAQKLGTGSVINAKIGASAVTSSKVAALNITGAKMAAATITADKLAAGIARIKFGTYLGDGAASLAITGVGFTPSRVDTIDFTGSPYLFIKHVSHGGNDSSNIQAGTTVVNGILSLDADGFTVGNNVGVNTSGQTYGYTAWGST